APEEELWSCQSWKLGIETSFTASSVVASAIRSGQPQTELTDPQVIADFAEGGDDLRQLAVNRHALQPAGMIDGRRAGHDLAGLHVIPHAGLGSHHGAVADRKMSGCASLSGKYSLASHLAA